MIQKKFEKTSITINRVLGSVGMDYFTTINVMPQPVEPDKMRIEDNYDIYEIRTLARATKGKATKAIKKPDVVFEIPRVKAKISYASVAKSVFKGEEPAHEIYVHKNNQVSNILLKIWTYFYFFNTINKFENLF